MSKMLLYLLKNNLGSLSFQLKINQKIGIMEMNNNELKSTTIAVPNSEYRDKAKALLKKISRKAGETIAHNRLLEAGDKVLVGVSGGKDSYTLLEVLADRKRHLPFDFEIFAVHVIIKEAEYINDLEFMKRFCESLGIPLKIIESSADLKKDPKKSPCFVCSWTRRKLIFNYGKEININKLAFGHHRDDAIQTYLLNLIYHGSISSMPYTLSMFDGRVNLIRPLLDIDETLIEEYTTLRNFPKELKKCPYDKETKRSEVHKLMNAITQLHPNAKKNLFKSMGNIFPEYLPVKP